MAMTVGKPGAEGEVMVEMNTTPLIDVMLVLLIMLIITIPVQTHAVKLDMPQPTTKPPDVPPVVVNIEVDFDGTITWDGNPVPDRATLEGYMVSAADKDPQPEIHLKPNGLAHYGYVAEVLAEAQRLHLNKIGFVGNEAYMD
jgi:biopolymer transport protein ExbD